MPYFPWVGTRQLVTLNYTMRQKKIKGKYNECIPHSLLKKQFIEDFLDFEGLYDQMLHDPIYGKYGGNE